MSNRHVNFGKWRVTLKQNCRLWISLVLLTALVSAQAQSLPLATVRVDSIPKVVWGSAAWGDIEGDGDFDLALVGFHHTFNPSTGSRSERLVGELYKNDGLGNLVLIPSPIIPSYGVFDSNLEWIDFDRDGDLDLIQMGQTNRSGAFSYDKVHWLFYENQNGVLSSPSIDPFIPGFYPSEARANSWGDYDNDGDLDLLATGSIWIGSSNIGGSFVYKNEGGTLFDTPIALKDAAVVVADWIDLDGDGRLDLFLAGEAVVTNSAVRILRNQGGDTFESTLTTLPLLSQPNATWADFNLDGYPDLLLAGHEGTNSPVSLFMNDRTGHFSARNDKLPAYLDFAVPFDADADGDMDLLLSTESPECLTRIFLNSGQSLDDSGTVLNEKWKCFRTGAATDINRDGNPDVLLIYTDLAPAGYILLNPGTRTNSRPPIPTGYAAEQNANRATFSWRAAGANLASGLTYNLRVGRSPGASDVLSAEARADGPLLRPKSGNVGARLSHTLTLPAGEYFWAVQSVDNSFNASSFTEEQRLVISPSLPIVTVVVPTNVAFGSATLRGFVNPNGQATKVVLEYGQNTNLWQGRIEMDLPSGSTSVPVQAVASNLTKNTSYYYRLLARNVSGEVASLAYTLLYPNMPPTIAHIPSQSVAPNRSTAPIPIHIEDFESDPATLKVEAKISSSGPGLLTPESLLLSGAGSDRTLVIAPLAGQTGRATIVIQVTDPDGGFMQTAFRLNVGDFTEGVVKYTWAATRLTLADFNGDGWLDLLRAIDLKVLRNDRGANISEELPSLSSSLEHTAEAVADFDADGDIDIIQTGSASGNYYRANLFLNNGDATFVTNRNSGIIGMSHGALAAGDFDNDGDTDVVASGRFRPFSLISDIYLYQNNGKGIFTNTARDLPGLMDGAISAADYDADGDLDFALRGLDASSRLVSRIYRNDGRGSFVDIGAKLAGVDRGSLSWGDFDADGDLDLLIAGTTLNTSTTRRGIALIYRNDGNDRFSQAGDSLALLQSTADWGDYDNDGDFDILYSGSSFNVVKRISFFRNDGNGVLNMAENELPPNSHTQAQWGDFDNDSDLDVIAASTSAITLYKNNLAAQPTPVPVPKDLFAGPSGAEVILSWSPNQVNPAAPLTYNIRCGTVLGGDDVMPSMSDRITGKRLISGLGNAGPGTRWRLEGLAPGKYFWTVQAINASFSASDFAPERSFDIPEPLILNLKVDSQEIVLSIAGPANARIALDESSDLMNWRPAQTNQVSNSSLTLPFKSDRPPAFYRARLE